MKAFPTPLPSEEEARLLVEIKNGSLEARDELIRHNLRLVVHIVKKYGFPEKDMEDYISIGIIGLIKGIDTFNAEKGNKLATYVSRCIDNEILMSIRSQKKQNREVFLNDSISDDKEGNEIHLFDILWLDVTDMAERFVREDDISSLREAMNKVLNEREQQILYYRYGFYKKEYTQREISMYLNISRSYVSRIEKRAIRKLKAALEERNQGK